ncbi:MAG: hypothetical protein CL579_15820 [Alteromonadaceae bacterium]|nr:hypothetical protein [Alteromonadaceae bacterium]MBB20797.1 hypothetical protein [Rickettsiales bacterium]
MKEQVFALHNKALIWVLLALVSIVVSTANAKSYVPASENIVVAKWTVVDKSDSPKERVALLLSKANLPGLASRYYGQASALTETLLRDTPNDIELSFYQAKIAQHYHRFDTALSILTGILRRQENHPSALLLKANILLVQGRLVAAKQTCLQLLGKAELWIGGACALEVNAQSGNNDSVADSYAQLLSLVERSSLHQYTNVEQQRWVQQILAELAAKQGMYNQAISHLAAFELTQVPVSYLALWADIQLALNKPERVLRILGPIVEQADSFDDALLIRLALSENQISDQHTRWTPRLTQRINIRMQRKDTAHAADIARYFLDIAPDRKKALFWAKINWQQARLDDDKRLLERAMDVQYAPEKRTNQSAGM